MRRVTIRYMLLACSIAMLALVLLAAARSYAQPFIYAQLRAKSFWAIVSTRGQLHWVSYQLDRSDTTIAAVTAKQDALTCQFLIRPTAQGEASQVKLPEPLVLNVDFPLI